MNPFCVSSDETFSSGLIPKGLRELHDDSKSGGQHSFSACLSTPASGYQNAFLASQLGEFLIAYNFLTQDSSGASLSDEKLLLQTKALCRNIEELSVDLEESKESGTQESNEQLNGLDLPTFQARILPSSLDSTAEPDEDSKSDKKEKSKMKFCILKFGSEQDAFKYIVKAKQN